MALTTRNMAYRRSGYGAKVYVVAAPTADPGTTVSTRQDGYFALHYNDGAARKVPKGSPWADVTGDIDLKWKSLQAEFDPSDGPKVKKTVGVDEVTMDFEIYDLDPAHTADIFGVAAADVITAAAATGKAARTTVNLGPTTASGQYCVLIQVPKADLPGEFWHWLAPLANITADLDLKISKKGELKTKVSMSLQGSPYLMNALGLGTVLICDEPTGPAL